MKRGGKFSCLVGEWNCWGWWNGDELSAVWGGRVIPGSHMSRSESGCSLPLCWGDQPPPGWVFPRGVCPARAACGPAATGGFPGCRQPPNWRGSCFPPAAALSLVGSLVASHHTAGTRSQRCLLPLPPEAGRASICQQRSSLWPSPPRAPLSLCPEVLAGFIPPKSLLCLPRVSPGFSWCCLPGGEVSGKVRGVASPAPRPLAPPMGRCLCLTHSSIRTLTEPLLEIPGEA